MFDFPNNPAQGQNFLPPNSNVVYTFVDPAWYRSTNGGDSSLFWTTRKDLVTAITNGFKPFSGRIYVAGGFMYIASEGATAIPDMPGLIPYGDVHVEHFGAVADLKWEMRQFATQPWGGNKGPYKLSGTDNYKYFRLTDDYVNKVAYWIGRFFVESGDYFIDHQLKLLGRMESRRGYRNFLWARDNDVWHSNIWITGLPSDVRNRIGFNNNKVRRGVVGLSIIAHCARTVAKPFGHGQMNTGVCIDPLDSGRGSVDPVTGEVSGPGIMQNPEPAAENKILENIDIDVRLCRAASGSGQSSSGAYLFFGNGGMEFCNIKLGVFEETNVASNGLGICHWNLWADGDNLNYPTIVPHETYHACDCKVEIPQHIDMIEKPHGFACLWECASCGTMEIGDISCRGVYPCSIQPGDVINYYSMPRQKEKIMKGFKVGYISAVDVPLKGVDTVSTYENGAGANYYSRGFGTSKFDVDMYPGTNNTRNLCRQLEVDLQFKGFDLRRLSKAPAWNGRAVYFQGCQGKLDLGAITTFGIGRGFEIEYCDGDQLINYVNGDGCLLYEFSRGGRLIQTGTNRDRPGYVENTADGGYRPGSGPGTRAVSVGGGTYSSVVSNSGDVTRVNTLTRTWIVPFSGADDDVYRGTPIKIGDQWVTATEFIQGRSSGSVVVANIVGITKANPGVITVASDHDLTPGQFVAISKVNGMTQINGKNGPVTVIDATSFSIGINTTSYSDYVSGGVVVPNLVGVPYVDHTPLRTPATEGQTVVVDEFCRIKQGSLTSQGGESAMRLLAAGCDMLDMHGLRSAGKYGLNMTNGRASLKGPLPMTVGNFSPVAECYTIYGDGNSLFSMADGTINDNPMVNYHFYMAKDSSTGQTGHVDLRNCRIANIAKLFEGNNSKKRFSLSMYGCTDTQINQLLSHPARQGGPGSADYPGSLGYFNYGDDGKLQCWVRGLVTVADPVDAISRVTWIFPAAFNGGGATVTITANIQSAIGAVRSVRVLSGSSTSVTLEVIGGPVGDTVSLNADAIGRWYPE